MTTSGGRHGATHRSSIRSLHVNRQEGFRQLEPGRGSGFAGTAPNPIKHAAWKRRHLRYVAGERLELALEDRGDVDKRVGLIRPEEEHLVHV